MADKHPSLGIRYRSLKGKLVIGFFATLLFIVVFLTAIRYRFYKLYEKEQESCLF